MCCLLPQAVEPFPPGPSLVSQRRRSVVRDAFEILSQCGATWKLEPESVMLGGAVSDGPLLDYTLEDAVSVSSQNDAVLLMSEWPTMGSLGGFVAADFCFTVSFFARPGHEVQHIELWILASRAFEQNEHAQHWFRQMANEWHTHFRARRTFLTWGLEVRNDGFEFEEEVERLRNGIYSDLKVDFELVDRSLESPILNR